MALEDIISSKLGRLNTVPDKFESSVYKAQRQIYDDILGLLDQLKRKNGLIEMTTENLLLIDSIADKTKAVVVGGDYIEAVKEFAGEFDKQAQINNEYLQKALGDFNESDLANQILLSSKTIAVESLVSSVDNDFIFPLKQLLNESISSGASWSEMVKKIRQLAEGGDGIDGKLLRYSKQIASDTFAQSDSSYTNSIAEDMGIEWFKYSGGELSGTRPFCHAHNGKFYHKKEIQKWPLPKSQGGQAPWAGEVKNTDSKSIFIYRGGYSCKHSIMPVSLYIVPTDVIKRNIDSGNFTPTAYEKKELGL